MQNRSEITSFIPVLLRLLSAAPTTEEDIRAVENDIVEMLREVGV